MGSTTDCSLKCGVLENGFSCRKRGKRGQNMRSKVGAGERRSLQMPGFSLEVNQRSQPFSDLLQQQQSKRMETLIKVVKIETQNLKSIREEKAIQWGESC